MRGYMRYINYGVYNKEGIYEIYNKVRK